jgi:hypothetical protein
MSDFTYDKYDSDDFLPYIDGGDALAGNAEQVISFQHVPTSHDVYFKAYITAFNETFVSDWVSEPVYGRPDPIYMYKNTVRKITLSFKVPAATEGEAYDNLGRLQKLLSFLYPRYSDVQNAQTISQSPLIRLKVMNLLQKADDSEALKDAGELFEAMGGDIHKDKVVGLAAPTKLFAAYKNSKNSAYGLLGVINNVNIDHHLGDDIGTLVSGVNTILPKLLEITIDFNAIHEHPLGWDEGDRFSAVFPYNVLTDGTVTTYVGPPDTGASDAGDDGDDSSAAAEAEATMLALGYKLPENGG